METSCAFFEVKTAFLIVRRAASLKTTSTFHLFTLLSRYPHGHCYVGHIVITLRERGKYTVDSKKLTSTSSSENMLENWIKLYQNPRIISGKWGKLPNATESCVSGVELQIKFYLEYVWCCGHPQTAHFCAANVFADVSLHYVVSRVPNMTNENLEWHYIVEKETAFLGYPARWLIELSPHSVTRKHPQASCIRQIPEKAGVTATARPARIQA